jgi:hypothetical protein
MSKLSKKQKEMWSNLNYVPAPTHLVDLDINSLYVVMNMPMISIKTVEQKEDGNVTIRIAKNR